MVLEVGASPGDVALLLAAVQCHSEGERLVPQIRHRIRQLQLIARCVTILVASFNSFNQSIDVESSLHVAWCFPRND